MPSLQTPMIRTKGGSLLSQGLKMWLFGKYFYVETEYRLDRSYLVEIHDTALYI